MNRLSSPEYIEFDPVKWVRDVRHILWRQRRAILSFFTVAMLVVVAGLIFCPREYLSDAKLFVKVGRESVGLDPTATTGATLPVHQTRESEIVTVTDMLRARGLYEQVVRRIGPNIVLGDHPFVESDWRATRVGANSSANPVTAPDRRFEKAVKELRNALTLEREAESSVISLACTSSDSGLARALLTEFIQAFQEGYHRANRTDGAHEFFEQQTEEIRQEYGRASEKLKQIREQLGSVSIFSRRESIQKQIDGLEQERLSAVASLDAAMAMISNLEQALLQLPERSFAESVSGQPDDAVGSIRRELSLLSLREGELLSRYTEHHPEVQAVRRKAEQARRVLENSSDQPSQVKDSMNPAWNEMHVKLLYERSNASSLRARVESLDTSLNQIWQQLAALNDREAEMVNLEHTIALLRERMTNYAERIEQSRIEDAMGKSGISNVNVVQTPSLLLKPVSPRLGVSLMSGMIVAMIGAVSFGLLREMFQRETPVGTSSRPETTNARPLSDPLLNPDQGDDHFNPLQNVTATAKMLQEARY